ncbi:MAG: RnfABCDGE type electron transport complex subunit B [Desulfobacterales bacterium]|nr:RnfABCDGE type electron transport complex subunit B [Desulfobacterales bacterium]
MLEALMLMGGLGILIGSSLAVASKVFYVYIDPKVEAIDEALPGANCGGCGFPGCSPNAQAIVDGISGVDSCVAAGSDVAVAIAEIMGVSVSEKEPEFAVAGCYYHKAKTDIKYSYDGIADCRAADLLFGGMKECKIGCLGLGTCVNACVFDALSMGDDGLPKVDQNKCIGCGACEKACPKNMIALTSVTRRIIREYTEDECITPCQRACPVGIDIREYIRCIKVGDHQEAVKKIKERNPFPTVIGRICPAFCEIECRRQLVDEPVAINDLKRFVCDLEKESKDRVSPYKAPETGKKIAIVGGGVEGLSAAYFSARLGHDITVMEATDLLGGLLRVAIPEERLPQEVLEYDIEGIIEAGVKVKTKFKAGKDFTIPGLLKDEFEAVFMASGGWDNRVARGDINDVVNVFPGGYLLIDLLREGLENSTKFSLGKNVVIAGSGNRIFDAVNILKKAGVQTITILSRKNVDKEMVEELEKLGASIVFNSGIKKLFGKEETLTQIEYLDLTTGVRHVIDADSLIISSGRFPQLCFVKSKSFDSKGDEIKPDDFDTKEEAALPLQWEGVEIYKEPTDRREQGFLSSKDPISGYSAAIIAINGGRKAAVLIHHLIYDIPFIQSFNLITKQSILQQVNKLNDVDIQARNVMPVAEDKIGTRVEHYSGFSKETASKESERCLRCGILCYERSKHLH